ncbi:MAG: GspH/FimT family pseudopilin [Rhizobiaceae bacterium]
MNGPNGGATAGFTLLEMLVTLTILAMVVTGFAVNMARRDNTPTPRETAKQVQSMLYLARSDAIGSGESRTVVIDTKNRRFDYRDHSPVTLADGQKLRVVAGRELISSDGKVSLVFLPDGGSSGADIEVTDARERSATLRINWLTGLPALLGADRR